MYALRVQRHVQIHFPWLGNPYPHLFLPLCISPRPRVFLRRIIAPFMPRMTATNSRHAAHRAADRAVLFDRFDEVIATRWMVAAIPAQEWAERVLIDARHRDQDE